MKPLRIAAVLLLAVAATASADALRAGKWEYVSRMKMAGMPQMPQMPAGVQLPPGMQIPHMDQGGGISTTFQQCITDANPVPSDGKRDKDCKITKQERSGNTINWAMHCESADQNLDGEGTATYTGDTMTSSMKLKGTSKGHPVDMTQEMTGRYLGPCSG